MKIYIAGPMTGIPEFNAPAFNAAEKALKILGFDVENPAINGTDGSKTWQEYMRMGLRQVLLCDGIALLPGYQNSRGAKLEVTIARALDMDVRHIEDWTLLSIDFINGEPVMPLPEGLK